jgi:hypothetical protein
MKKYPMGGAHGARASLAPGSAIGSRTAAVGGNATFPLARNLMPSLKAVIHCLKPEAVTPDTVRVSALPLARRKAEEYPLS